MSDLSDILEPLYDRVATGIKPGLGLTRKLLEELGNPQDQILCVHVAGTNGKGSVCAMVEAMLRAAGLRTGLFTSPHLQRFNERFKLDGEDISDELLRDLIAQVLAADEVVAQSDRHATFFEVSAAIAYLCFAQDGVQVAVIETGLGGRWDATNVICPLLSVITRIAVDHSNWLGDRISSIASEKAGIIKKGRPVVCSAMPEEALGVMQSAAAVNQTMLLVAPDVVTVNLLEALDCGQRIQISTPEMDYPRFVLPLIGEHQLENVATAVTAVEQVMRLIGLELASEAVVEGLGQVCWPARFQILEELPPLILDGAHNVNAAESFAKALRKWAERRPVALILGMLEDKDCMGALKAFSACSTNIWAVSVGGERGLSADELAEIGMSAGLALQRSTLAEALEITRKWASEEGGVVAIAGSLYFAGEVLNSIEC